MYRNVRQRGVVLFVMCLGLTACVTGPEEAGEKATENSPEEIAAAQQVLDELRDHLGDSYPTGLAHFEMGPLDNGYAVLLVHVNNEPVNAAFWTIRETVYAVNLAANWMNRTLPNAPPGITENRVRAVVH